MTNEYSKDLPLAIRGGALHHPRIATPLLHLEIESRNEATCLSRLS